jgi:hypothetical protein
VKSPGISTQRHTRGLTSLRDISSWYTHPMAVFTLRTSGLPGAPARHGGSIRATCSGRQTGDEFVPCRKRCTPDSRTGRNVRRMEHCDLAAPSGGQASPIDGGGRVGPGSWARTTRWPSNCWPRPWPRHRPVPQPASGQLARLRCRERCYLAGLRRDSTGANVLTFDNDRSGRTTEVSLDGTQAYPW